MPSTFACRCSAELDPTCLVSEILELGKLATENKKSISWAEELECLRSESANTLVRTKLPRDAPYYVAVSYSSEATSPGSNVTGGYEFYTLSHQCLTSEVRDDILRRVIRYCRYVGIPDFWVDKDCQNPGEHQIVMDSMDLVYSQSKFPLGVLDILLGQEELDLLHALLSGSLVLDRNEDGDQTGVPVLTCNSTSTESTLKLLSHVRKDRWWTRAWIFQEEYLGGLQMKLLIRHEPDAIKRESHDFGTLDGEICMSACHFREEATRFLLAVSRDDTRHDSLEHGPESLLEVFGKYNVLYYLGERHANRAMSSRIFTDVWQREVTEPYDRLPVVANACDYAYRFSASALQEKYGNTDKLNACALTMYLRNGEVITDAEEITSLPDPADLSSYLERISFKNFDPPVYGKQLTWLKRCRFSDVRLRKCGIETKGYLWRKYESIDTSNCGRRRHPPQLGRPTWDKRLMDCHRDRLLDLADYLFECDGEFRAKRRIAARYLREFVQEDSGAEHPLDSPKTYMNQMAKKIVQAIYKGDQLVIADLGKFKEAVAIFVSPREMKLLWAFTSWHNDLKPDDDGRRRVRHLSLHVEIDDSNDVLPHMRNKGWVNGLAFFKKVPVSNVVVRWPEAWKNGVEA